jgi:hypothetical protein
MAFADVLETRTRPGNVRHLIYGLNPLITLLKQNQADVNALLLASRIPATALGDPDYMLTPAQELHFTELALAQLGQPELGIRLGPRYHLSAYGMLGLAVMTSSNLIEAFRVLFHNILMTWTYMHWALRTENGVAIITLNKQRDLGDCQYMIDRAVAAYTIAAEALGKALFCMPSMSPSCNPITPAPATLQLPGQFRRRPMISALTRAISTNPCCSRNRTPGIRRPVNASARSSNGWKFC